MAQILEKNYIIWNNFNTKDNKILIEQLEVPPKAEERKELIQIEGRNGYLTRDYDCYSPIQYEVQLSLYEYNQVAIIKKIFKGSGELTLSCCPDVYYKATICNPIEFERTVRQRRNCTVTFELQPLAYAKENEIKTIVDNGTIENIYNSKSFPYIKIYGSGTGNLYVNNETVSILNIDGYVELDCELEECYKDNENCNSKMIGDFPVLLEGVNTISHDNNIEYVEINPRWRTL